MYFNADGTIRPHHGNNDEYVQATKQVAEDNGIECIDLYNMSKSLYEDCYKIDGANGSSDVAYRLFSQGEKTHHSKLGGYILGTEMAIQIRDNSSIGTLSSHITVDMPLYITNDKDVEEFMVNTSGVFSGTGRNDSGVIDASVAAPEYLVTLENELLNNLMNSEPPTTESTTEASTETSTESTTESSTESTTETPDPTPTPSGVYGDADNNGVVNAADVAMIVEYVLSGAPYVNDVEYVDVSSDGIVDTKDATMILQHVLNQAYSIDKNKN